MSTSHSIRPAAGASGSCFIPLLFAWLMLLCPAHALEVTSRISSGFLVRGERALLEVAITGTPAPGAPGIPDVEGVEIVAVSQLPQTRMRPGRIIEHVFEYEVSSYQLGTHTIPPIECGIAGSLFKTEPLTIEVFPSEELQWSEATAGELRFRYAAAFRALNRKPYEGQSTRTEIKLYVPRDLLVDDWGIPELERDGVTAWRFQPSRTRSNINLSGLPYVAVAYPSTLTPSRSGRVALGPASIRLVTIQMVIDGFPRREAVECRVQAPRLELDAPALPAGAPQGFRNAVGDFRLSVHTEEHEYQEGDPIPVEIRVSGTGNLDALAPPAPIQADGWKIYEATRDSQASVREEVSGTTVFRQFVRPLEVKGSLPPYQLVFFDPVQKQYRTLTTEPIPLLIKPAPPSIATSGPPVAAGTPVERMTDILGILQPASLTVSTPSRSLPRWFWHSVAGALALVLLARALWLRIAPRLRKDPETTARNEDFRSLAGIPEHDHRAFLLGCGRFIERWIPRRDDPELQAILAERDHSCFRPDSAATPPPPGGRRAEILRVLQRAVFICAITFFLMTGARGSSGSGELAAPVSGNLADLAQTAYQEARFDEAIRLWLQAGPYDRLSPDTLYNIGNACYRSGSPGHAALYYRRALLKEPGHGESLQNLRFIERKYGSLTVHRPDYQTILARLSLGTWKQLSAAGAWICLLGFLVFPATRPGVRIRIVAAVACLTGPLLATIAALGWYYYPNDSQFAPVNRQAVIVAPDTVVFAEASRNATEVIDAPPGSLCEIIRLSGRWAYISFASKTRGWVPADSIDRVMPASPPQPPRIRKPKADGKSA